MVVVKEQPRQGSVVDEIGPHEDANISVTRGNPRAILQELVSCKSANSREIPQTMSSCDPRISGSYRRQVTSTSAAALVLFKMLLDVLAEMKFCTSKNRMLTLDRFEEVNICWVQP